MAIIPLRILSWSYNDETGNITGTFDVTPAADDADPANFVSDRSFSVELKPTKAPIETRRPVKLDNSR